jgi:AraC-like DNA-binding protein
VLIAASSIGLARTGTVYAHDSLAPAGAPHTWLPAEDWVAYHWIPFDEQTLKRTLGIRGRDLEAYLYNDHHTLADLATRRGVDPRSLAAYLVASWRPQADEQQTAVLNDRALRLLTQGHLAQHVFFHVFHNGGGTEYLGQRLGMSSTSVTAQRARGLTFSQIAQRRGVAPGAVRRHLADAFRRRAAQGVELGVASPSEAARILARQEAGLPCWLRRPHPARDSGNPYGKATRQHGEHLASWPASARERVHDEAGVERVRRSLARSCWRPPPRWTWTSREPLVADASASHPLQVASARQDLCRLR